MKKKEYIILAIIIVLLGGYLLLRSGDRTRYELPVVESVSGLDISRIEISAAGNTLVLSRKEEGWTIGEKAYPADSAKVSEIVSALEQLKLTALVSETGVYSPYNLTDDQKITVRAWALDRKVRDLSIGKAATTYQHTFVRLGDDANVYHAEGNFRQIFELTIESLRDKTALSFSADDITGINIVSGEKRLSLTLGNSLEEPPAPEETSEAAEFEPAEPVWMKDDGTPADADTVDRMLSQLAYLNCSSYLEGRTKEDFNAPGSTITLKGKETYTLSLFESDAAGEETGCPAVSSQNDYPFTLSDTACTRLTETVSQILESETEE